MTGVVRPSGPPVVLQAASRSPHAENNHKTQVLYNVFIHARRATLVDLNGGCRSSLVVGGQRLYDGINGTPFRVLTLHNSSHFLSSDADRKLLFFLPHLSSFCRPLCCGS